MSCAVNVSEIGFMESDRTDHILSSGGMLEMQYIELVIEHFPQRKPRVLGHCMCCNGIVPFASNQSVVRRAAVITSANLSCTGLSCLFRILPSVDAFLRPSLSNSFTHPDGYSYSSLIIIIILVNLYN